MIIRDIERNPYVTQLRLEADESEEAFFAVHSCHFAGASLALTLLDLPSREDPRVMYGLAEQIREDRAIAVLQAINRT